MKRIQVDHAVTHHPRKKQKTTLKAQAETVAASHKVMIRFHPTVFNPLPLHISTRGICPFEKVRKPIEAEQRNAWGSWCRNSSAASAHEILVKSFLVPEGRNRQMQQLLPPDL